MMTETIVKHKWFWAWQDDKEEQWLESMSENGYHLVEPGVFGRYVFEKGQPQKYVYRLDFMTQSKDRDSYLQLFKDAGWEYLGQFGSWQYFRKSASEDDNPEIFSNVESKIKKYQRVLTYIIIFTPIYLLPLNINNILHREPNWLMNVIFIFWAALIIFFGFSAIKIIQRINALKNSIKQ
jgi:hypothetical protein